MRKEDARNILEYYGNIPEMLKFERQERELIEDTYYNALKSPGNSGMPHGISAGHPTERMGIKAAEHDAAGAVEKADIRIKVLLSDREIISGCLDTMNGKYKKVLLWKCVFGYTWAKISVKIGRPESTCRYWYELALERFAEIIENDVVMADELVSRASRAR